MSKNTFRKVPAGGERGLALGRRKLWAMKGEENPAGSLPAQRKHFRFGDVGLEVFSSFMADRILVSAGGGRWMFSLVGPVTVEPGIGGVRPVYTVRIPTGEIVKVADTSRSHPVASASFTDIGGIMRVVVTLPPEEGGGKVDRWFRVDRNSEVSRLADGAVDSFTGAAQFMVNDDSWAAIVTGTGSRVVSPFGVENIASQLLDQGGYFLPLFGDIYVITWTVNFPNSRFKAFSIKSGAFIADIQSALVLEPKTTGFDVMFTSPTADFTSLRVFSSRNNSMVASMITSGPNSPVDARAGGRLGKYSVFFAAHVQIVDSFREEWFIDILRVVEVEGAYSSSSSTARIITSRDESPPLSMQFIGMPPESPEFNTVSVAMSPVQGCVFLRVAEWIGDGNGFEVLKLYSLQDDGTLTLLDSLTTGELIHEQWGLMIVPSKNHCWLVGVRNHDAFFSGTPFVAVKFWNEAGLVYDTGFVFEQNTSLSLKLIFGGVVNDTVYAVMRDRFNKDYLVSSDGKRFCVQDYLPSFVPFLGGRNKPLPVVGDTIYIIGRAIDPSDGVSKWVHVTNLKPRFDENGNPLPEAPDIRFYAAPVSDFVSADFPSRSHLYDMQAL